MAEVTAIAANANKEMSVFRSTFQPSLLIFEKSWLFQNSTGSTSSGVDRHRDNMSAPRVPVGLTAEIRNAALRLLRSVCFGSSPMNDVVDRILNAYQLKRPVEPSELRI